ncbi:hypothetical protein TrLO_g5505 [Triparma laevis f. longispina]|uniref:Uncharacterized protein n=1 Tax=Triparma laevis f. longispina TaxID=1714387 RepID=A0A9W7KUF6_9STRA|nr:hypothetical protein TrLO_g5505 [Triparma laevis f. longispina]
MAREFKREKPLSIDKLAKPALIVCVVAILWSLGKSIFSADTIHRYSPLDSLQMSSLFSPSSSPSVVLCLSESEMEKGTQLNSAFYDASLNPDLSTVVTFITLDCESKMLNGDVINQKYSLDLTIKPATVFMTNSPGSKKIIKFKGSDLKSGAHLSKAIRHFSSPRSTKIKRTGDLQPLCLDLPYCLAILKSGDYTSDFKEAVKNVILKYPEVAVVNLDSDLMELKGVEGNAEAGSTYIDNSSRLVMFRNDPILEYKFYPISDVKGLSDWVEEGLDCEGCGFRLGGEGVKGISRTKRSRERAKKRRVEGERGGLGEGKKKKEKKGGGLFGNKKKGDTPPPPPESTGGDSKDDRKAERARRKKAQEAERKAAYDALSEEEKEAEDRKKEMERKRRIEEEIRRNAFEESDEGARGGEVEEEEEEEEEEEVMDLD